MDFWWIPIHSVFHGPLIALVIIMIKIADSKIRNLKLVLKSRDGACQLNFNFPALFKYSYLFLKGALSGELIAPGAAPARPRALSELRSIS